jgi:ABC-2 type transport system permease protein
MRAGHIWNIAVRINRQIRRDPRLIVFSLGAPVVLVLLLKWVLDSLPSLQQLGVEVSDYAVPVAAFFIHFITYVLSTIALIRDRNSGTMARTFVSTYRRGEIVLGYLLGYSLLASVQAAITLGLVAWLFELDLLPDLGPILATLLALAVVSVALGLFVSSLARTEGQIFPFIPLLIVPSILLSDLVIPLDTLSDWLQALSRFVPLFWAEDVLQGILNRGETFQEVLPSFVGLLAFGAVLVLLSGLTLKERD